MVTFAFVVAAYVRAFFVSRHKLAREAVALRQQLAVFKRREPRPKLHRVDRLFWIALRHLWPGWAEVLIVVKPETVMSWHRAGFRLFWRLRSRFRRPGRPKISQEIRQLIRRMKTNNPSCGAPRIHGELLQLGFDISEPTVSRYLHRLNHYHGEGKAKHWFAFLSNHREVIAAFDFFTVPTLTFRVLYCFFVIEHGRRRILHFNTTAHPTGEWIVQQLREAFPLPCPHRYVVLDRDAKFGGEVVAFLKASGITPIRTSVREPVAERNRGALGWKLPPRVAGSRDSSE
jgi:putative transposase